MIKKIITILIIFMIILYPFFIIPVAEISLREIYQRSFENVDEDFIIKSIRTTLYFYFWVEKSILILFRPFILGIIVWGGAKFLSSDRIIPIRTLFVFFFSFELVLLLNDYFNIGFNYYQLYNNKIVTINVSPLNLSYFFNNLLLSKYLKNMIESISVFSLLYFILIFRFIKKHYQLNDITSYVFIFNLIVVYIIMAIVHPGSLLFGVT